MDNGMYRITGGQPTPAAAGIEVVAMVPITARDPVQIRERTRGIGVRSA